MGSQSHRLASQEGPSVNTVQILGNALPGLLRMLGLLVAIVIPLTIVIELVKEYGVFQNEKGSASRSTRAVMRLLGMSEQAAMPLAAGFFFGLAYGAGLILQFADEGELSKRDRILITLFLVACHAVVEDTLLFVPLGVNPFFLFAFRLGLAILLTAGAARFMPRLGQPTESETVTHSESA